MDQSLNRNELAMAMLRTTVQPTGEESKRVGARLHELHCNSGLCSNRTLADRLRRDGAPQSVCKHAMVLTCYACESRATSTTSATEPSDVSVLKTNCGVKDYMDLTLESQKQQQKSLGDGGSGSADGSDGSVVCAIRR